jgi:hypothetical protein
MFGDRLNNDNGLLFVCPNYDCGWCYASLEVENTNDINGECNKPLECKYRQELMIKAFTYKELE